jgi:hypothetical protein
LGLKLNGTHHLQVYADDVNLLREIMNTINRNMDALLHASEWVGLEGNMEKTVHVDVLSPECRAKS